MWEAIGIVTFSVFAVIGFITICTLIWRGLP